VARLVCSTGTPLQGYDRLEMKSWSAQKVLVVLGTVLGIVYLLAGIIGGAWPSHWEDSSTVDRVLWFIFLAGGGLVLLAGLRLFGRSPSLGAALVSAGALAGALAIFWTIAAPLAAIALVVLSVVCARQGGVGPQADAEL
jgi:hypothetical protein